MAEADAERSVSFSDAFRFWLKLGFISFGGPAGQIAIMHKELVDRRRWIGEERFLHALNFCMLLPGPEAHQLAIYIGWLMHRVKGGIVAGALFVIPSIFILLALSYVYAAYGHVPAVNSVIEGFKPVVVAIVVEALFKIGKRALKRSVHYVIAAAAFVAIYLLQIPFPLIVVLAAVAGFIGVRYFDSIFASRPVRDQPGTADDPENSIALVIKDDVVAAHSVPDRRMFLKTAFVGLLLWSLPFVFIAVSTGSASIFSQQYRFFSVSALVTFGGAYAVLAYVTQAVTEHPYNWLSPAQAIDGLALAETTPGPLIMVLQFIGFVAGWNNPPDGISQLTSGVIGALVATYTTFLPSFLFIFLGAPYIEKLRGNVSLTGALSGVTAAVVGVILNLALVFGITVISPSTSLADINVFAVFVSLAAFIALFTFKVDVLWVVLAGGIAGFFRFWLPQLF